MSVRNVVFLHIPKAAGSTLRRIIERQYRRDQVFHVSTPPNPQVSMKQFRKRPRQDRESVCCVTGHGPFGIHEALVGPTEYVTLLRNPVERVISNYYYVCRTPEHRFYDLLNEDGLSLREYVVDSGNLQLTNGMTRQISGNPKEEPDESTLARVKDILREHFGVVGTVKRFDESLLLMKRRYGWGNVAYQKRNATRDRPTKEDLSDKTLQAIKRQNQLDSELYSYVEERLEEQLRGVDLDRKLRSLTVRCWLHSWRKTAEKKVKRGLSALGLYEASRL